MLPGGCTTGPRHLYNGAHKLSSGFHLNKEKAPASMTSFNFVPLLPAGLPAPAVKWTGFPKYNFVGGNNDAEQVPVDGLDGGRRPRC